MDCSLPDSSAHGILQARILSGLPFSPPRDLSNPGIQPGSPALQADPSLTELQGKPQECSNYCTIALISHSSKVMLKILEARLLQSIHRELPEVQSGFRKGRGTRDQIVKSIGWSKKQESSRKTSISALLTMSKPLTVWITTNCGKFLNKWAYQATLPVSWEICMQVKKQQLKLDIEQWNGSKLGKENVKAAWPCLVNLYTEYIMQNSGLDEAKAGI